MAGNSFLNAFMPSLPWWFLVIALTVFTGWMVTRFTQLCVVRRREIERPRRALEQARDALARVIADDAVFGDARSQALSAYESVGDALRKEKD